MQRIRGFALMRYINPRLIDWLIDWLIECNIVNYKEVIIHSQITYHW